MSKTGVLLVNLGTPNSFQEKDVKRYLLEFLLDKDVIDLPFLKRQALVRGIIVPRRYKESAAMYRKIWKKEGSPLLIYGKKVRDALSFALDNEFEVVLGMRYQNPSISSAISSFSKDVSNILVIPLFPQAANATTGSICRAVKKEIQRSYFRDIPVRFISHFYREELFIAALAEKIEKSKFADYEKILFSYHGLPVKQLIKNNPICMSRSDCCQTQTNCYKAQCLNTSKLLSKKLQLSENQYRNVFQSRLGNDPWIKPYTSDVLKHLVDHGVKKVLVVCPSFVSDCLETLFEIQEEYRKEFLDLGGEQLDLVEGINDSAIFISLLKKLCLENRLLSFPSITK